ncbi:uncharacterized protein TNCV_1460011 [Trichonephila clavipes]|nr:uncharacterized protein TNCV_1460011 [Trichonephila clavipes]
MDASGVLNSEFLTKELMGNSDSCRYFSFASRQCKTALQYTNTALHWKTEIHSDSITSLQPRQGTIRLLVVPKIEGIVERLAFVRYQSRQHPSPFWRFSLELNTRIRPLGLPPSEHHWYQCSRPGGSLAHGLSRQDQNLLAHFRSGHIKSMKFSKGRKSFEMCTNCSSEPATPAPILECLGLTKQDLADDPLLALDFLKVHDVMDLV